MQLVRFNCSFRAFSSSFVFTAFIVLHSCQVRRKPTFEESTRSFCSSKDLSSGYWTNDSSWQLSSSCRFLEMESGEVRRCLEETDFLIGGNSISRAIHFELLEYLNYTEKYIDRVTQKALCDIPFEEMFETHIRLYEHANCSAMREGYPAAHFFG